MPEMRVIPVLLLAPDGLVKTVRFGKPTYVGDPINAVRIFNEKEVDEIVVLDIGATREERGPDLARIREIAGECFMPLCYGGGVRTLEDVAAVVAAGAEKVAMNTRAVEEPAFLREASARFGASTLVASLDVKRTLFGKPTVRTRAGRRDTGKAPADAAREMEAAGAGEILLNSVDRDGTMEGYDLDLVAEVAAAVSIPVVACGGAGSLADLHRAVASHASAAAAGSLFVFQGPHRAVLISYPSRAELEAALPAAGAP
jgi:cyclase